MASQILVILLVLPLIFAAPPKHLFTGTLDDNPDQVTSLPGLDFPISYRHYSGLLDSVNSSRLHYWFFESQSNTSAKDPLVLWLNGGPGCSSMIGALSEQGPLHVGGHHHHHGSSGPLYPNKKAPWNAQANLLFIESPPGVGFSYAPNPTISIDDWQVADFNFAALKSFFAKFPQLSGNDFYIVGEGYASVYVTTLSDRIVRASQFPGKLVGFGFGNGFTDIETIRNSFLLSAYYHGIYDSTLWEQLIGTCCVGITNLEKCDFFGANQPAACKKSLKQVLTFLLSVKPFNWEDVENRCENSTSAQRNPDEANFELLVSALQPERNALTVGYNPSCTNYDHLQAYLNRQDVREALHIDASAQSWSACSMLNYVVEFQSIKPLVSSLLAAGQKGLIYGGDLDVIFNNLGAKWFAESLKLGQVVVDFRPWTSDATGQVAGFVKVWEATAGLAYATVKGAGHRTGIDRPVETLQMYYKYIVS